MIIQKMRPNKSFLCANTYKTHSGSINILCDGNEHTRTHRPTNQPTNSGQFNGFHYNDNTIAEIVRRLKLK